MAMNTYGGLDAGIIPLISYDNNVVVSLCSWSIFCCLSSQSHFSIEQDAHELFHVLTSSLEDERDQQPRVTHLFDVQSLEVTSLRVISPPGGVSMLSLESSVGPATV